MITTNDDKLAERIAMLRNHGQKGRYLHAELGWNYRMTNIAAAIGLAQLEKLDERNDIRRKNAKFYDKELADANVDTPYVHSNAKHVYHQYTIKVKNRDVLLEKFKKEGIGFGIYYPRGIHQQPVMQKFGFKARLPVTESLVDEVVSLPVHPALTQQELEKVAEVLKSS